MSHLLDFIFPRPYDQPNYYQPSSLNSIKYFPRYSPDTCLPIFKYTGVIRKTIIDIKYHFVSDAIYSLAGYSLFCLQKNYPHLLTHWHRHQFTIVPIPLHPHRLNWRGFNQASLLAKTFAQKLNLPYAEVLHRYRPTLPQVSFKDKNRRRRNLHRAFSLLFPPPTDNILLFDDVTTTYSTLRSAASVFRKSKIKNLSALTIAG